MKRKSKDLTPRKSPAVDKPRCTRLHVFFSGTVQGVGFRYTALTVAGGFLMSGWVRNLTDGRVELVGEGQSEELEKFLDALAHKMSGYISHMEKSWDPATGEWSTFEIVPTL